MCVTPPNLPRIVPMFRICWCVPVRWEWPPVSLPQWEASHAHFYQACIVLYYLYMHPVYLFKTVWSSLSSTFSFCVCVFMLWFAFLCHTERIHTIVYSHNPFVFPLLFINHSLYFSFDSALLCLISLSCLLLSSSHAMYPLTFLIFFYFYIPSSPSPQTLSFFFSAFTSNSLPLYLFLSRLSWCQ